MTLQNTTSSLPLENTYLTLPENLYARQNPSHVPSPKLVYFNHSLAQSLGLNEDFLQSPEGVAILSGNQVLENTTPIAQAYAGHQFGYFTMLGDGRAVLLGEYVTPKGERLDFELKGSGRTPYSRRGDGKATLGPMLREYLISEAMAALGIPTTRSLAVVTTGELVSRETPLLGAVLTRLAKSHIRVGTFEYLAHWGTVEELKALADYTIERHFKTQMNSENPYLYLLKSVIQKQAELIAKWQLVGFIHGVMNTDNMVLSGETIDYGPCAFMDTYALNTVFSSIDAEGRYAYGNQPKMALWNLARFAETLVPLLHPKAEEAIHLAEHALSHFNTLYKKAWQTGMRKKLGLLSEEAEDESLISDLLSLMQTQRADYTYTFLGLTLNRLSDLPLFETQAFKEWYALWQNRLSKQPHTKEEVHEVMMQNNPTLIPRNHLVEAALKSAVQQHDYEPMTKLLTALEHPYDYTQLNETYMKPPQTINRCYQTFCGT